MIVRWCIPRRTVTTPGCITSSPTKLSVAGRHSFHSSTFRQAELPNHYATLDIAHNASAAEIKKQFYKLSKSHHPDLHPNDPSASQKFVQISEAYAVLGSAEKRARYDRDLGAAFGGGGGGGSATPRGSYSSSAASGPGGRPASGLSKRRTQFRGPPPSFYRAGGWGAHADKRGEAAAGASHTHEAQGRAQSNAGGGGGGGGGGAQPQHPDGDDVNGGAAGSAEPGMGPGGFATGLDDDVPHFDHRAHTQTHSGIERTRHRARRKRAAVVEEALDGGPSVLFNFFLISGMLGGIYGITQLVGGTSGDVGRKKTMEGEGRMS